MAKTEQLYDVVVYNVRTRIIQRMSGVKLRRDSGRQNAEKRARTTIAYTAGKNHGVEIVETGKYAIGDKLPK